MAAGERALAASRPLEPADPFPIPFVAECAVSASKSARVLARGKSRRELAELANDSIRALNELYDPGTSPVAEITPQGKPTEAALNLLHAAKRLRPPRRDPYGPTGVDALRELTSGKTEYASGQRTPPTYLRVGDVERVAEPQDTNRVRMQDACSAEFLSAFTPEQVVINPSAPAALLGCKRRGRVFGSKRAYIRY